MESNLIMENLNVTAFNYQEHEETFEERPVHARSNDKLEIKEEIHKLNPSVVTGNINPNDNCNYKDRSTVCDSSDLDNAQQNSGNICDVKCEPTDTSIFNSKNISYNNFDSVFDVEIKKTSISSFTSSYKPNDEDKFDSVLNVKCEPKAEQDDTCFCDVEDCKPDITSLKIKTEQNTDSCIRSTDYMSPSTSQHVHSVTANDDPDVDKCSVYPTYLVHRVSSPSSAVIQESTSKFFF